MVELADARDSKSRGSDTVWVRPPPPAPNTKNCGILGKKCLIYCNFFYIFKFHNNFHSRNGFFKILPVPNAIPKQKIFQTSGKISTVQ